MNRKSIVLTGFMGTGKTTTGRLLAARTGRAFVDTDELIMQRTGKSIAAIFAGAGEQRFRDMEADIAQELAGRQGLVIATGGRLMLDPDNAAALGRDNLVLCLQAKTEEILERLAKGEVRRPLLEVPDPGRRVRELLQRRAAAYARFPQIGTSNKSTKQVATEIINAYDLRNERTEATSTPAIRLPVTHPGGSYDVVVGDDLLGRLRSLSGLAERPVALISDSNVGPLYAEQCDTWASLMIIPAGEQHKRLDTVRTLYHQLLSAGLDRSGAVVALGGGVVGDVAGFVAATYMRGVPLVQCPTSLLAMVDASVGGKTGVDLPEGKNLVGAFKQPLAVLAEISTLNTLPPAEVAAGMAEIVKHGLIADPDLLRSLETEDWHLPGAGDVALARLRSLIVAAIRVKRDIVQADPFEEGRRAWLNLGHTFAHAIERVSNYKVTHGRAVAMGLVAAAHLSATLGHCQPALQSRIEQILRRLYLPARIPADLEPQALLQAMSSDKKKAHGRLRFVLLRDVGEPFVTAEVPEANVLATLGAVRA